MSELATPLDVSKYICHFDSIARSNGIQFKMGDDFNHYIQITENTTGKPPTYPNFRPNFSELEAGRAFWIIGEDQSGKVAHLQAVRLYDLTSNNLAEHLESLQACYAYPKSHSGSGSSCVCRAPTAQKITGTVAYHGDLWLRDDFRRKGLPPALAGIAFGLAWAKWSPDFIYALVPTWLIEKGIADRYGYLHKEEQGAILSLPAWAIKDNDWLIWLTRCELSQIIKRAVVGAHHHSKPSKPATEDQH
ncbi:MULTISPECIES: hypothetical protein [unclassified Mesorhizobium]|uniref:hypothetical protein n=1 Tax=unclassified Mesorhizobium TaxID=325217 RepID=UPI001928DAEA|nr:MULTISPECIES: hypothetical protein [unclassified Mesorhizobium]